MKASVIVCQKLFNNDHKIINPLSQEGGGGGAVATPLPFRIFPRAVFAKIAIRSIYPSFVQIPIYL